jgi:hypothetical protein
VGRVAETDERNADRESYESVAIDGGERKQRRRFYPERLRFAPL